MAQKRFLIDAGFETNADSKIAGDLDMTTHQIVNIAEPTLANHAATKFYVDEAVTDLLGTAPDALNTLNELAAALGDDANFASTTATQLGLKADITYVDSEISAATPSFATLTGKPTTLAGYGITDSITSSDVTAQIDAATPSFSTLTGKPTTIAGYGITDGITATAVTSQVDAASATSNTYTDTAEADAVATASADATTKADAALVAAESYADTAEADAIASAEAKDVVRATAAASDATTKADAAEAAAITSAEAKDVVRASAAASDATTKADAAQAAAISAAAADATTKANTAKAEAISEVTNGAGAAFDTLVEIQNAMATDAELSSAISSVTTSAASTAASDATTKANAAQAAAISTAASDATTKANAAQAAAISSAASDATTKANAAQSAAQSYADANDANTTYTAGNGMTLSGTQFLMSGAYTGNFTATGDITAYSDDSLKTNVQLIDGALDRVQAIRGVTFDRISDGSTSTGVIAQELKAVLPEAVHTDANGVHSVAYGNITGLLIEAVKELSDQVNSLKSK